MSLLEKLNLKKEEKNQRNQEAAKQEKLKNLEEIDAKLTTVQVKKQKISALKEALLVNYTKASKKLNNFKNKKEKLSNTYEEHKDLLAEDGIKDFAGMLEANAEEQEVQQYRQAGGRGPDLENGEAGQTGELYEAVANISEIKKALQTEMPEMKLNFSETTKEGQGLSNRDKSFIKIDEYIKTLDNELLELKEQRADAYSETPEGKKESFLHLGDPSKALRDVRFHQTDNFHFNSDLLNTVDHFGAETIKENYATALKDKLCSLAWENKSLDRQNNYNIKSQEQLAIENYPMLNKLDKLSYSYNDRNNFAELHEETLKHLEKIFTEHEAASSSVSNYGIGRGNSEDYEQKKKDGWNDKRILAERYLKYATRKANLGDYDSFTKDLENSAEKANKKDFAGSSREDIVSPEYARAKFAQYNKFLEYIKNNTNADTKFVEDNLEDSTDLISTLKNGKESRQAAGLEDEIPERRLKVPVDFINESGGFQEALSRAKKYDEAWQTEQAKLAEISTAAVNSRFAQDWERHFSRKNEDFLETVDYEKKLAAQLENTSSYLKNSELLTNPEFANRKIKIATPQGGFNDGIFNDLSSQAEYQAMSQANTAIKAEMEEYAKEKIETIKKAIISLEKQLVAFGRAGKIETLKKQWQAFSDLQNNKPLDDKTLKDLGIDDKDIAIMKDHQVKRNAHDAKDQKYEETRLKFLNLLKDKNIKINLKRGDSLDSQEMTMKELPNRLEARLQEIKTLQNNFSESELAIINGYNQAMAAVKVATDEFNKARLNNAEVLRKYKA